MSAKADNIPMENETWKSRLADAVNASDKSKRQISLDSGNGPGYVHSILSEGKDPTITKLIGVCRAVPASPLYIIHGLNVSPLHEQIITALEGNPDMAANVLAILGSKPAS